MKSLKGSSVDDGAGVGPGAGVGSGTGACSGAGAGAGEPGVDEHEDPVSFGAALPGAMAPLNSSPSLGATEPRGGFLRQGGAIVRAARDEFL